MGWIFLAALHNHDRFFFMHTFRVPASDFNVKVTMNKSCSYTLMSGNLKTDVVCDVTMSTPNVLTTELRDLLYNPCINMLVMFYPSHGTDKGI